MSDTQDAAPSSTEQQAIASAEVAQPGESSQMDGNMPADAGAVAEPAISPSLAISGESGNVTAGSAEAEPADTSDTTSVHSAGLAATPVADEDPNAATGAAAQPDTLLSASAASTPSGISGIVGNSLAEAKKLESEASSVIRSHLAAIKTHLSVHGFEQSTVQFIHDVIDKIEKWL